MPPRYEDPPGAGDSLIPKWRAEFPGITEEQLQEMADVFSEYTRIAWRIYERISADPKLSAELDAELAERRKNANKNDESSIPHGA